MFHGSIVLLPPPLDIRRFFPRWQPPLRNLRTESHDFVESVLARRGG